MIWLTGLPCSGKTTLAYHLHGLLENSTVLDGDEIRKTFNADLGRSPEDRIEGHRRIAEVAKEILRSQRYVIVSVVSPLASLRGKAKEAIEASGHRFIEVYVKAALAACIARDVKGMYKKALDGEDFRIAGLNDPYEEPVEPDVVCNTDQETIAESAQRIIAKL